LLGVTALAVSALIFCSGGHGQHYNPLAIHNSLCITSNQPRGSHEPRMAIRGSVAKGLASAQLPPLGCPATGLASSYSAPNGRGGGCGGQGAHRPHQRRPQVLHLGRVPLAARQLVVVTLHRLHRYHRFPIVRKKCPFFC
jgi:hypothetical protein